jgi:hypothetical protein
MTRLLHGIFDCPTGFEMCVHWEYRERMCFCIKDDFVQRQYIIRTKQKVQVL